MADAPPAAIDRPLLGLLFRVKARILLNRVQQAVDDAPLRVTATVVLIGVVWAGLWLLFMIVFNQFERTPLEAAVAMPLVFNFFFMAILALLTFSNAIIAYGALFGKNESSFLATSPLAPLDVVTLKYLESLAMSSWSLVLLGLPLMIALARQVHDPVFYLLFIAFFLAFIPIPGALGMLLAWAAAHLLPRRIIRGMAAILGLAIAVFVVLGMRTFSVGDAAAEVWLRSFLAKMSFVESAFLPNQWVSAGIDHALQGQFHESTMYLIVTMANALFLSWIAVRIVSSRFVDARDRAASGRSGDPRRASTASGGVCGLAFVYLPLPMRLIAAKDMRTFLRDPLQWSQLVILLGLLTLYLTNMPTVLAGLEGMQWTLIGPFLNLCAMSLILATFTCRFVFPLVSLEGHNLWMIGLLPLPRSRILLAKFAFAMTVTLSAGAGAMLLATHMLSLSLGWALLHLAITIGVCFGLCAFSVGIGARLPMFGERNVARIANGLGGTTNLLASLGLVSLVLVGAGLATHHALSEPRGAPPDLYAIACCGAGVLASVASGCAAMRMGARHFRQVEA